MRISVTAAFKTVALMYVDQSSAFAKTLKRPGASPRIWNTETSKNSSRDTSAGISRYSGTTHADRAAGAIRPRPAALPAASARDDRTPLQHGARPAAWPRAIQRIGAQRMRELRVLGMQRPAGRAAAWCARSRATSSQLGAGPAGQPRVRRDAPASSAAARFTAATSGGRRRKPARTLAVTCACGASPSAPALP